MICLKNVNIGLLELIKPLSPVVLNYKQYTNTFHGYQGPIVAAGFYIALFDAICLNEHISTKGFDKKVYSNYVLCHEFIHWTGHPSRLNRKAVTDDYKEFLNVTAEEKQEEEMTADLGTLYIHYMLGLDISITDNSIKERKLFMSDESFKRAEIAANLAVHWILDTLAEMKTKVA